MSVTEPEQGLPPRAEGEPPNRYTGRHERPVEGQVARPFQTDQRSHDRGHAGGHDEGHHEGHDKGDPARLEADPGEHRRGSFILMLRESVIVIGMALLLSLVVKTWLMQAFYIPSESMESTLLKGDRVIVSKLTPSPIDLNRGDIVVFEDPDHWLPVPVPVERTPLASALHSTLTFVGLLPNDEGNHLIKRVIGLPGDRVVCCDANQKLTVNGVPLNEPYLFASDAPSLQTFDITVPKGRVWVMGDHRSNSADSRPHDAGSGGAKGTVPESLIVGRAITVVWPIWSWSWLANPGETFDKVPAAAPR